MAWHEDEPQEGDSNFHVSVIYPPTLSKRVGPFSNRSINKTDIRNIAYDFYNDFNSACRGISIYSDLDRLYRATFATFSRNLEHQPSFKLVLMEMIDYLKVCKLINQEKICWNTPTSRYENTNDYNTYGVYRRSDYDDSRFRSDDYGRSDYDDSRFRSDDYRRSDYDDSRFRSDDYRR